MNRGRIVVALAACVVLILVMQLVPYGWNHENPPVVKEPAWDPATRALAQRGCFNCHSHETVWPWYSRVAPASWLVYHDVMAARRHLNFSDWHDGKGRHENWNDISDVISESEMPPVQYRLFHPEARLAPAEKEAFLSGMKKVAPPR